jgi:hypothetical protein
VEVLEQPRRWQGPRPDLQRRDPQVHRRKQQVPKVQWQVQGCHRGRLSGLHFGSTRTLRGGTGCCGRCTSLLYYGASGVSRLAAAWTIDGGECSRGPDVADGAACNALPRPSTRRQSLALRPDLPRSTPHPTIHESRVWPPRRGSRSVPRCIHRRRLDGARRSAGIESVVAVRPASGLWTRRRA